MEAEEKKEEVVETIDWETRYKYLAAELDNTKKRFQKDMISYKRVLTQHILTSILPVYESIINAEKQTSIDLTSIKDQFINCLKNIQISKIEVKVGDKLDPEKHQAVHKAEDSDGTIKEIVRTGWMYEDNVLIPAMVVA